MLTINGLSFFISQDEAKNGFIESCLYFNVYSANKFLEFR
jgi:hypothetical protein